MSKVEVVLMDRPDPCPEENCQCLDQTCYTKTIFKEGFSFFCVGKVIDEGRIEFTEGNTLHDNQFHFCIWTPMKGWIKLLVNTHDLFLMQLGINSLRRYQGLKELTGFWPPHDEPLKERFP